MKLLTRRQLLGLTIAAPALLGACDSGSLYGIPAQTPIGRTRRALAVWHADAVPGQRLWSRTLIPSFERRQPEIEVVQLPHGDPDDLARRVEAAAAGGVGPDVFQAPGEWLPDLAIRRLVAPLGPDAVADGWSPGLIETARWRGVLHGVPATVWFRQPFYNDELLRNAGLFQAGRTTAPSTWAEFADVSKRVAGPDGRWGSLLPSQSGDEELYLHVLQHVHTAGGELPRRDGARLRLDTAPMEQALRFLLELVQRNGAFPLDRPQFRLPETGRVGLWWTDSSWLGDQSAVGATLRVGAALVPRQARGGAVLRSRHWCVTPHRAARDEARALLAFLSADETSHQYCAALSLPPARRANWAEAAYTKPREKTRPFDPAVWRAIIDQLGQPDNLPLATFPGYREVAGRVAGEFHLVLTGKKAIADAIGEGGGGADEIFARTPVA